MRASLRLKRTLAMAATGALVLTLLPGVAFADTVEFDDVCEGAADADFPDIGSTHADAISCMNAYGVIEGRTDGTFGTQVNIQRQQFASLMARFALVAAPELADVIDTSDFGFTDLVSVTHSPNVNALANLGIVEGTTATTFSPNAELTRAQAATVFVRAHEALGVEFDEDATSDFEDLGETHGDNINKLVAAGIVEGYDDTTFGYSDPIQRGQIASLLARSAAVLDSLGLWDGSLVETNQTFMVAADETQVPAGTNINVTADVGDAEEVTIWLLDADGVDVDNGNVSFEATDDGDFETGNVLDPAAGIVITEVDGVAVPDTTARTVAVVDGELELVVNADAMGTTAFVVFIAETDAAPVLDADGVPEEAFGVTATITQQDIAGLGIFKAGTDTLVIDTLLPAGQDQDVTVVLADADFGVVALDGESIDYVIASVESTVRCDELQAGDDPLFAEVVVSTSAMTVGGAVSFTVPGGADGDVHCVVPVLDADEDGLYAAFDGVGAFLVDGHGAISYDEGAIGTTATFVDGDDQFVALNGTATVQVEVLDQFGNPSSGVTVTFETDGSTPTSDRTTNASGIASFAFSESDNGLVTVDAFIDDVEDVTAAIAVGSVEVYWYEAAADGEAHAGDVLYLSGDSSWVVIDDAGVFLRVDVESGQLYSVDGAAATFAGFTGALEDEADLDFTGLTNTQLAVNANYGVAATTTYTLTTANNWTLTLVDFPFAGSEELTADDPVFTRPNASGTAGGREGVSFQAYSFTINAATDVQIDMLSSVGTLSDAFLHLYAGSFDPTDPTNNYVAGDDDGGAGLDARINENDLAAGTYIVVATTWQPGDLGTYDLTIAVS